MPEGDTIFRAAKRLHGAMAGREVTRFETSASRLLNVERVGRKVVAVRARGKHLLMDFDDGKILHSHLRMRGRWSLIRRWTSPIGRSSVVIELSNTMVLGVDLAIAELLRSENRSPLLAKLGPDLLGDFDADEALRRIQGASLPLGVALMRQDLIGGIGNVYKSELLFLQRLDPFAPASEVSETTLRELFERARTLMKRNLGSGYLRTTRKRYGEGRLWVYGRSRELCLVCGGPIRMKKQAGRSTYYCPSCQAC